MATHWETLAENICTTRDVICLATSTTDQFLRVISSAVPEASYIERKTGRAGQCLCGYYKVAPDQKYAI